MTIIESSVDVNQAIEQVYSFLADFNNHQHLMPEQISNWSSTYDSAQFDIKNMGTLVLKIQERITDTQITLLPEGRTPFPLSLVWSLKKTANGLTQAQLAIKAELNMMMKMMASGPLQQLTEAETSKLKAFFEK